MWCLLTIGVLVLAQSRPAPETLETMTAPQLRILVKHLYAEIDQLKKERNPAQVKDPAQAPPKPFASIKEMFANLPKEYLPTERQPPTDLQYTLMGDYFRKNIIGKPAELTCYITEMHAGAAQIAFRVTESSPRSFSIQQSTLTATFPRDKLTTWMGKTVGSYCCISGTIRDFGITSAPGPRAKGESLYMSLGNCEFKPLPNKQPGK